MVKRMMNKTFLFLCIFIFLLTACAGRAAVPPAQVSFLDHVPQRPYLENDNPVEPLSGKTAFEFFKYHDIRSGWNLGNTQDAFNDGISGETVWGNPRVNQEIMNGVRAAGFDIIRIPVTWMGDIGPAPDHRISARRLARVSEIVEMARQAGLKVIINIHHDGSTDSRGIDHGWLSIRRATANREEFNRITAKYVNVWRQIALYFRNYGDWLIFESFNELHDGGWQTVGDVSQLITLNRWNQLFVDVVRSTGGNNANRFLLVGAYCKDYRTLRAPGFMMPTDTVEGKLIVSFHYYDPHQFAIQGTRSNWGTDADRQRVIDDFAPFKEEFINRNIIVLIGECGAVLQLHPDDPAREAEARQSRLEYITHVFETARRFGLVPIYWDNGATTGTGEKFGLFNRNTGMPNSAESEVLIRAMINAVR